MTIQEAILTVIVIICVFLAGVSFFSPKKPEGNIAFSLMSLLIAAWATVTFFEEQHIAFFFKSYLVSADFMLAYLISIIFLFFTGSFIELEPKAKRFLKYLFFGLAIFFAWTVVSGNVVSSIENVDGSSIKIFQGSLYIWYTISLMINFAIGTYALFVSYKRSSNEKRIQLKYIMFGLAISATIAILTNLIIPQLYSVDSLVPRLGIYSITIFLTATTIAMTRYRLFNVKVIATEFFVGVLLLVILSRFLTSNTTTDFLFEGLILFASALVSFFLIRSVRDEVSRREEIEKLASEKTQALTELEQRNKNLRALQKISDIVLNENDMKIMTQKILDELPHEIDHCIGGLLSTMRKGNLTASSFSTNPFSEKIYSLVDRNLESYSLPLKAGTNKLHDAIITKKTLDSDSLADFISPPINRPVAMTLQKLIGAKHMEAFPLYAGGVPFGALLFVFSASRDEIHGKNFEIAKSVADEMSLAIQRAEAFQQLKDANEYLSQLDKMKDEFISMASHELNTPLAAIEGYLSMILDEHMGGKIDAKTKEYLSRAYDSSKRLAELVLDLLNVSRVEQGRLKMKFTQVNLADLAESVVHELQIKADAKKVYLKVEADKKAVPLTWCDPDRIREVFVNLAGNAIKFTEKGGVTIKVAKGEGETIIGSVTDTGRGIAKEDQKKLFQKFSQIHREVDEHQGTGLGLYISKNFVELHKGTLSVESDAGKGATFSFTLPIVTEAPKQVEGAILDGPLSAPKVEAATGQEVPAIITASSKAP